MLKVVIIASVGLGGCRCVEEPPATQLCDQLVAGEQSRLEVVIAVTRPPGRRDKLCEFFAQWGRRGDACDQAIRDVFDEVLNSHAFDADRIGVFEDLLEAVKARLREDPSLILQFGRASWKTYWSVRDFIGDTSGLSN